MKKRLAAKPVLCLSMAALLVIGADASHSFATGICAETSLAGISLSLEQYAESAEIINTDTQEIENTNQEDSGDTKAARSIDGENEANTEEEKKEESKYANVGISIANDYVNIRKKPDTESKILGKLYRGAAATIVKTTGDWVKIESGSVTGYIKSEFLAIGYDAEELEDMFGTKWATVNTTTLKVREKKSTDSIVLGLIPIGETFQVIKEYDEWVKILLDEGDISVGDDTATKGYVSKDYVDISVEFEHAISIKEEEAEKRREEKARQAEEERLRKLAEEQEAKKQAEANANNSSSSNSSSNSNSSSSSNSSSNSNSASSSNNSSSSNSSSNSSSSSSSSSSSGSVVGSGDGAEIAAYALNFVGNPYKYGGTSLTNGADCSGFVQTVFSHFGVSIPRDSRSQSAAGKKVSFDSLKAGDLIFYTNSSGTVNHVALYLGGGQVVHASNPKNGIKVSTWNYRTPYTARRMVE